jgi:CubicO group peptidase (beta-lactamase class C family)
MNSQASSSRRDPRSDALDQAIDRALADERIVGAVVLVSQHGRPLYQRAAGYADRESKQAMQIDTLFRYSSLTKPIVTAALLALAEQSKLALDQPVSRWLPDFHPQLAGGDAPVITLHQLLNHTAGLSYPFKEPADAPYHRDGVADGIGHSGDLTLAENVRRIAGAPLSFAPGSAWRYSLALDVLGAVIEQASGETLPQAVERLVTGPLRMRDTGFRVVDQSRLAAAYANTATQPELMTEGYKIPFGEDASLVYSPARAFDPQAFPSGGAGMVGSAPDMLRFLDTIRGGGGTILPPAATAQMMRNQTGALLLEEVGPGWSFGYGGAVLVDPAAAQTPQSPGTWRWGGVYGHSWFVDPQQELSVVALTNTALEGIFGQFTLDVRNAVYS